MTEILKVNIEQLAEYSDLPLPSYGTKSSAGVDLYAAIISDIEITSGKYILIPTGIKIAMPDGYEGQIRPRSGLALKYGITVLNTPGTIDADYRGEIKVLLINHGEKTFTVKRGDRIAQLIINKFANVTWIKVNRIDDDTDRSEQGFGSTGYKL